MPLPFSVTGRVHIAQDSNVTAATDSLEHALEQLRAKRIRRGTCRIEFTGGVFRAVPSYNLLVPVGSGTLSLSCSGSGLEVVYQLRFTQMLLIVSGLVLFVLGPPVIGASNLKPVHIAGVLVLAWLWLFGANLVLTLVRFPRWVQRTVAGRPSR